MVRLDEHARRLYLGVGVTTLAGGSYFALAILRIRRLHKTNVTLPAQVMLGDNVEYENKMCQEVLPLNSECFVLRAHLRKSNSFKVDHSS